MRNGLWCAGALTLALMCGSAAMAQDTGLAGMHTWVRVGGKTCLLDHYHDGSGSGPTRASAMRAAIGAWSDFTAFEYGNRWGSYRAALGKRMGCSGGPGGYNCSTSARPCRF